MNFDSTFRFFTLNLHRMVSFAGASLWALPLPVLAQGGTVANPYGLQSVWNGGDAVARVTLLLLVGMSLLSWYLILAKWFEQRSLASQADAAQKSLGTGDGWLQRAQALPNDSTRRLMTDSAIEAARRHMGAGD